MRFCPCPLSPTPTSALGTTAGSQVNMPLYRLFCSQFSSAAAFLSSSSTFLSLILQLGRSPKGLGVSPQNRAFSRALHFGRLSLSSPGSNFSCFLILLFLFILQPMFYPKFVDSATINLLPDSPFSLPETSALVQALIILTQIHSSLLVHLPN